MKKTFIIGIAGVSSSGKTTLGKVLKKLLKNTKIIHLDGYWKGGELIPKSFEKWREWENPKIIDFEKLYIDLIKIKNKNIGGTIIVEGFHLFYNKKIRDITDLKVYLEIPNKLVVDRRIKKFGRKDNQEKYSEEIVIKEYKKYGKPTKKYADLIFSGAEPVNSIAKKIIRKYKLLK